MHLKIALLVTGFVLWTSQGQFDKMKILIKDFVDEKLWTEKGFSLYRFNSGYSMLRDRNEVGE